MVKKTEAKKINLWKPFAFIAVFTFLLYAGGLKNEFLNWDDQDTVVNNEHIRSIQLSHYFTTFYNAEYSPLVMLVYSILYNLNGADPFWFHFIQLLFHLANCWLVLWLIYLLTRNVWLAFAVSLLFGIHPMHVESVIWISELKDVMYAFGFLLSLIAYVRFIQSGDRKHYLFSLGWFIFSLLSKAMGVSLVPVLLLIDFFMNRKLEWKNKIPFLLIALAAGVTAVYGQRSGGALNVISHPFHQQVAYASYVFFNYVLKLALPINLSALYSYPPFNPVFYVFPALLICLTAIALYSLKRRKEYFLGFAFFLLTVLLVLQFLPVGKVMMADRYIYIPSVGFFFIAGWTGFYFVKNKSLLYGVFTLAGLFYSYRTVQEVKVWQSSETLWTDVIGQYPNSVIAHFNRAQVYVTTRQFSKAMADVTAVVKTDSLYPNIYYLKGVCNFYLKNSEQAGKDFDKAIVLSPDCGECYYNRAVYYLQLNDIPRACNDLQKADQLGYPLAAPVIKNVCREGMSK